MEQTKKINPAKSFIFALVVILVLMIAAYVLTFVIPAGEYKRILDANGNLIIDTTNNSLGEYTEIQRSFPFYKFILSPFLVFGSEGSGIMIAIIAFLIIISGVFEVLTNSGLIEYILKSLVKKYYHKRYVLISVIIFFLMCLGSLIGSFEEVIPMVPFIVALAIALGFDAVTGLLISFIAVGCGFSTGILNPFTVGVAQKLVGLPLYSGSWIRILAFAIMYIILVSFVMIRSRKIENKQAANLDMEFNENPLSKKATTAMGIILGIAIIFIISSAFITVLQDYTLIFTALAFLIAGITASVIKKISIKTFLKDFGIGIVKVLPSILLIMMASSIKYILTESARLDTLVKYLLSVTSNLPRWSLIIIIYLIVLLMEFFVSSGSAKAFLLIPLITPLASVLNIPLNLIVLAYIFGDGFSNMIYPTNVGLLISLSLSNVSYKDYIKKTGLLFVIIFVITILILLLGLAVGYC